MKPTGLILAFVLFQGGAWADTPQKTEDVISDVLQEVNATHRKLADMQLQAKANDDKKAQLDRETQRLAGDERRMKSDLSNWKMDNDANDQAKQRAIDSGCRPGQSTTDRALYNRCQPLIDTFNTTTDDLERRGNEMIASKKKYDTERNQLTDDTVAWAAQVKRVNAETNELTATLKALESRRDFACRTLPANPSPEQMKHGCGNVQFDMARLNLPPCDTAACKEFDSWILRQSKTPKPRQLQKPK